MEKHFTAVLAVIVLTLIGGVRVGSLRKASNVELQVSSVMSVATGTDPTVTPEVLTAVTESPITPTVPVAPNLVLGDPVYLLGVENFVDRIAFKPNSADVVFTARETYEQGDLDLFRYTSNTQGELDGPVTTVTGLAEGNFKSVKSNAAASEFACGTTRWQGGQEGGYYDDIVLVSSDGSQVVNFTNGEHHIADYWWLPDGTAIIILKANGDLIEKRRSDGAETVLAPHLIGESGGAEATMAISPDSNFIALSRIDRDFMPMLEVIDRSLQTRFMVTKWNHANANVLPVFSSDSSEIYAFLTHSISASASQLDLYAVDPVAYSTPTLVTVVSLNTTDAGYVISAISHPSQSQIFYARDWSIYRINTDGSGDVKIAGSTSQAIWGEMTLQIVAGAHRLAYVSTRHLAETPQAPGQEGISTEYTVHSISVTQ